MIAQKQESSVALSRVIDAIFSSAEVWPSIVVSATFRLPRDWWLGGLNRAKRSEVAPVGRGKTIGSMRATRRACASGLSRNLVCHLSSCLLRQAAHLKLAGHVFA
jgi:hypothetical protein